MPLPIDESNPIDSANDANPQPIRDPEEVEAPEADGDTTNVPERDNRTENMRRGDLAEADAVRRLEDAGYETYSIKNGSGHGTDVIAIHEGPPPRIRVIEVKARTADLSELQQGGGVSHTNNVMERFNRVGRTWDVNGGVKTCHWGGSKVGHLFPRLGA